VVDHAPASFRELELEAFDRAWLRGDPERCGAGAVHPDVKRLEWAVGVDLVGEPRSGGAAHFASHCARGVAAGGSGCALAKCPQVRQAGERDLSFSLGLRCVELHRLWVAFWGREDQRRGDRTGDDDDETRPAHHYW
jgi:hypothetical protein